MTAAAADTLPCLLVEAFSDGPCAGNGAAVVRLPQPASAAWMRALARSLNQSETAFLLPAGEGLWSLRWFTPSCEVDLCGHATLAAALALGHWGLARPEQPLGFLSRSGRLMACLETAARPRATIQLPRAPLLPIATPADLAALVHQRLAVAVERCWGSAIGYTVALLPSAAPLAALPSLADALTGTLRQGLVLMQPLAPEQAPRVAGTPAAYQLRFFAPGLGIPEDPVTGSAHALVAPYWLERLGGDLVRGWQCSDRPGGMVCRTLSSGMIALTGSGHVLWDGCLRAQPDDCGASLEAAGWPSAG